MGVLDPPVVEREVGALLLAVLADHRAGAGVPERMTVEHPRGDVVDHFDTGDAVLVLRRRARRRGRALGEVGIGVDDEGAVVQH